MGLIQQLPNDRVGILSFIIIVTAIGLIVYFEAYVLHRIEE